MLGLRYRDICRDILGLRCREICRDMSELRYTDICKIFQKDLSIITRNSKNTIATKCGLLLQIQKKTTKKDLLHRNIAAVAG